MTTYGTHYLLEGQPYMPGDVVCLRGGMGDINPETGKPVTVADGTEATIVEFFTRENGGQYARLSLPTSPGQKTITTSQSDFNKIWRRKRPTVWERLLDDLGVG